MNILNIMSSNKYVSGQKIAGKLGISRAAVHKQVKKLKKDGYVIKSRKNLGYSLVSKPDLVTPEELRLYLPKEFKACKTIIYRNQIGSTQFVAKKLAEEGLGEGTLILCEKQNKAYGRLQRFWDSPQGGIWFSIILRPDMLPEKVPQITLAMSISIARVVERSFKLKPFIKWPNDIILNGKKLCGILTEMSSEVGHVNWVAAGVGINANNELPRSIKDIAISLKEALRKNINRSKFLSDILIDFFNIYGNLVSKGFSSLKYEYDKYSFLEGKNIKIKTANTIISGKAQKVDKDGYLLIKTAKGIEKIIAGDASVEK